MRVVRTGAVPEDSSMVLLARVTDTDDALPPAASIASIVITIFDLADQDNQIDEVNLAAPYTGNWFDALQTGSVWAVDGAGFNFKYVTDPAHMPAGDRVYRFTAKFTFSNGAVAHQCWDVPTLDLKRS